MTGIVPFATTRADRATFARVATVVAVLLLGASVAAGSVAAGTASASQAGGAPGTAQAAATGTQAPNATAAENDTRDARLGEWIVDASFRADGDERRYAVTLAVGASDGAGGATGATGARDSSGATAPDGASVSDFFEAVDGLDADGVAPAGDAPLAESETSERTDGGLTTIEHGPPAQTDAETSSDDASFAVPSVDDFGGASTGDVSGEDSSFGDASPGDSVGDLSSGGADGDSGLDDAGHDDAGLGGFDAPSPELGFDVPDRLTRDRSSEWGDAAPIPTAVSAVGGAMTALGSASVGLRRRRR